MPATGRWLHTELNLGISQRDVDFVVPRLDADLPLCIDPFLLYKSKRADLRGAHSLLLSLFDEAFRAFREKDEPRVRQLISFPEVEEIRFGYAEHSTKGRGVGNILSSLVIDTLRASPALLERGLKHVEELQLFSKNIASDRVSDIAANVIKQFLVSYTQQQAVLWGIPLRQHVPLHNIWDVDEHRWVDQYVTLPVDPKTNVAVLLVPRWIVRRLPWINYDDFLRADLGAHLKGRLPGAKGRPDKTRAIELTRAHVQLVDSYIQRKEKDAIHAQPDPPPLATTTPSACDGVLNEILQLPTGKDQAYQYQLLVLQLLNCLFEPELVDGQPQSRTVSGVEIRDLVFSNESDMPFLDYLRNEYGNLLVVWELKNTAALNQDDVNQLASYLGDAMGRCGFLLTRRPPPKGILAKARAIYNKMSPRRVVVILSDEDLIRMSDLKRSGVRHPVVHLQAKYREFVQSLE